MDFGNWWVARDHVIVTVVGRDMRWWQAHTGGEGCNSPAAYTRDRDGGGGVGMAADVIWPPCRSDSRVHGRGRLTNLQNPQIKSKQNSKNAMKNDRVSKFYQAG